MEPVFARPGNVATFPDKNAFIAFLERHGVKLETWDDPEGRLAEYWHEIEQHDTVYTARATRFMPDKLVPVRFLLTVAVRVRLTHPTPGGKQQSLVLAEYVRENGFFRPRRYSDTSLSEKMKLYPCGTPKELCAETLVRCLLEEIRMDASLEEVQANLQFMPYAGTAHEDNLFTVSGCEHVEPHVHEKKDKTPGLIHWNQVARYAALLGVRHFFMGWRQDVTERYISRWISVHEKSPLDPVPVELVLVKS